MLQKFLFEGLHVRGQAVRLEGPWQDVLSRRRTAGAWPASVQSILGQMTAAGVLLQSNIKFNGALVLQIVGDGPLRLAVVEVQPNFNFRATARVQGETGDDDDLQSLANPGGTGRFALTLDPRERLPGQQPYQGMVALAPQDSGPNTLAQVLEHYMRQSEQLDSTLVLAANDCVAAGLIIQRLPAHGGKASDALGPQAQAAQDSNDPDYARIATLAASVTPEELLAWDTATLLHKLFWQEPILQYLPQQAQFACTCSRERVLSMVKALGKEEAEAVIQEQGHVSVACEYCGERYVLSGLDTQTLFAA